MLERLPEPQASTAKEPWDEDPIWQAMTDCHIMMTIWSVSSLVRTTMVVDDEYIIELATQSHKLQKGMHQDPCAD